MADETHVIRGINWRETFPFTQIFRAFRVAIHPTKLMLALAALLALYVGGRALDTIWPVQSSAIPAYVDASGHARPNEIAEFEAYSPTAGDYDSFDNLRKARRKDLENFYVQVLRESKVETDEVAARKAAEGANDLGKVKDYVIKRRDDAVKEEAKRRDDIEKAARDTYDKEGKNASGDKQRDEGKKRDDAIKKAEDDYKKNVRDIYESASSAYERATAVRGQGPFIQFFEYEIAQVNSVAWAVLANDWLGGFVNNAGAAARGRPGVLRSIANFCVTGPWWMARYHTTYFILFVILFSIIWAVFGGAICRIAAVHVARDEKISLSSALRFSTSKFLSFIFAPIIPLLIVLVVGVVVMIGGLIGNIPGIGPFLVGLFFFLALAAGFVMTLVLLGTGGGFNLMYPTIAVEGSDSFDAISRSFSYVYARPWRMLFYTLVAVVYGALCFIFVRFFIAIMLVLTHHFVGAGMMSNVDDGRVPIDLWNTMWPHSTGQMTYKIDTMTLSGPQSLGAILVAIWVYLTVAMVGAFAISFYFSANTIIYYLMRREVDATELDDVYLEQSDEEFGDTAPVTAAPAGAGTAAAVTTTTTTTAVVTTPPAGGGTDVPPTTTPPPA